MTLVMGVDSSTQSCKVVIIDAATGVIRRQGRAAHPEGTSVDPETWWLALQQAITEAGGIADVAAWAIGGQQHGMVALDADGRVVRDALLWNDTRSAGAAADLIAEFGAEQLAQRTGLVPVASFTITKLRWLRDHEPANAQRVAAVALPHDWLTWRLRGFGPLGESPRGPVLGELVTDRSDASGTGYWVPQTGDYDLDLVRAALGHDVILPRVLGARESVNDSAGRHVGAGAGTTPGPRSAWGQCPVMLWFPLARVAQCLRSVSTARSTPPAQLLASRMRMVTFFRSFARSMPPACSTPWRVCWVSTMTI